jgi:hypothetical protein
MLWIELYGVGADGSPAEMAVEQPCFANLGAAIDGALRLHAGGAQGALVSITGFRIRNNFHDIIYEFTF